MSSVLSSNFSKVPRTESPARNSFREEKNSDMKIRHRMEGNTLVVKILAARLDAASAPEVKRRIGDWIRSGHRRLVLEVIKTSQLVARAMRSLVCSN
jgi:hypothetical protein